MSAITDLLFHSIADAHTIRLGEIAHITNGAGDVQDANTEHQEDWYPFFDRSEELKWFPTYSFDKEAVIYAELDMSKVAASRMEFDVCGHYARPDVLKLVIEDK